MPRAWNGRKLLESVLGALMIVLTPLIISPSYIYFDRPITLLTRSVVSVLCLQLGIRIFLHRGNQVNMDSLGHALLCSVFVAPLCICVIGALEDQSFRWVIRSGLLAILPGFLFMSMLGSGIGAFEPEFVSFTRWGLVRFGLVLLYFALSFLLSPMVSHRWGNEVATSVFVLNILLMRGILKWLKQYNVDTGTSFDFSTQRVSLR